MDIKVIKSNYSSFHCSWKFQLQTFCQDDRQTFNSVTSQDSDFPPPKSDSYSNLFDAGQDVPLGGSAYSLRNHFAPGQSVDSPSSAIKTFPPKHLYSNRPSNAISNSPVSQHVQLKDQAGICSPTRYGTSLASDEKYPLSHALGRDAAGRTVQRSPVTGGSLGSLNSRVDSLSRSGAVHSAGFVSSSPRGTVSPANVSGGSDSVPLLRRDELPVSKKDLRTIPLELDTSLEDSASNAALARRPMSFVRALEMSDQLASGAQRGAMRQQRGLQREVTNEEEEQKMHGSTYEIAVWVVSSLYSRFLWFLWLCEQTARVWADCSEFFNPGCGAWFG